MVADSQGPLLSIGRYSLFSEIAFGGMATVHIGRLQCPAGFSRTAAIRRLHPPFAKAPEFVAMALDEAKLAARIQHPDVVSVLDVVASVTRVSRSSSRDAPAR
jgi:eukaryotic-like serine/threonine-protein kinase